MSLWGVLTFVCAVLASCASEDKPHDPDDDGGAIIDPDVVIIDDEPSWSADGTKIMYYHYGVVDFGDDGTSLFDFDQAGLWISNSDGSNARMVLNGWLISGRFANTDDLVTVGSRGSIFRFRLEGDSLVEMTSLAVIGNNFNPAWSRDDSRIVYESNVTGTYQIWQMESGGSGKRMIPVQWGSRVFYSDWFPSGDRIITTVLSPDLRDFDLAVFDTTGSFSGHVAKTDRDESHPRVSPDGSMIAFERLGYVWIVNVDGTGSRRLVFGRRAAWSPDGEFMAYVTSAGPPGEASTIWIVNVRDGVKRPLTHGP